MPTKFLCAHCGKLIEAIECPHSTPADPHKLICGPNVTVDAIVEHFARIVLVFRAKKDDAEAGKWALPGGYVNYRERCADAAVRETWEETGLALTQVRLFGVYDDPRRDVFQDRNNVSLVYTGIGIGELHREPPTKEEVSAIRGFSREEILDEEFSPLDVKSRPSLLWASRGVGKKGLTSGKFTIAFDHKRILVDYLARRS
jgi:ADP-ribose pyrophosphatase YjhB (NUDIX family)